MTNQIPIIGGEKPEPQGPITNLKQLAYVLSEVHDDASPSNMRWWMKTAESVWSRIQTERSLPDPKGPCSCYPHWEFTDWGQPEQFLPEYDPACPEHSVHLYDPKSGQWVQRDAEPALAAHREAFRLIRERIKDNEQPLFIAADIDQIISEVGGEWEEQK